MKKHFQLSAVTIFGYLIWPLLFIVAITWALITGSANSKLPFFVKISLVLFITVVWVVPQIILTINYWRRSKGVSLIIDKDKFSYVDPEQRIDFARNDIKGVKIVWSYSKIYGNFSYWVVSIENAELILSSMLISNSDISKFIGEVNESKLVSWPSIKSYSS